MAPSAVGEAPSAVKMPPSAVKMAPSAAEDPIPTAEAPISTAEAMIPSAEGPFPTAEAPIPSAEGAISSAEPASPTAEDPISTAERSIPSAEDASSRARQPFRLPKMGVMLTKAPILLALTDRFPLPTVSGTGHLVSGEEVSPSQNAATWLRCAAGCRTGKLSRARAGGARDRIRLRVVAPPHSRRRRWPSRHRLRFRTTHRW